MDIQSIERRQNPRAYIEAMALITPSSSKKPAISGSIQDISLGGIRVKIDPPSRISEISHKGEEVEFMTQEDFFKFAGMGEVVWVSSLWNIVGIRFTRLSEESKDILEELLRLFPSFSSRIH
jgi:c-di-GMP-binding flagellar brake protein YcgR